MNESYVYKCVTYPGLGRYLTPDDIGKPVVRVFPLKGDTSLIPWDRTYIEGRVLTFLDREKIQVVGLTLSAAWIDNNWLTVNEFVEKTKNVQAKILEFRGGSNLDY